MRARMPLEHFEAYDNLDRITSDRFPIEKLRVPLELGTRRLIDWCPSPAFFGNLPTIDVNYLRSVLTGHRIGTPIL